MLSPEVTITALKDVHGLTLSTDDRINRWLGPEATKRELLTLQIHNHQVVALLSHAVSEREWSKDFCERALGFLIQECCEGGFLEKKHACLWNSGTLDTTWERLRIRLMDDLTRTQPVCFSIADLYAFNALGPGSYATYRAIVEPVIHSNPEITHERFGRSDSLLAYSMDHVGCVAQVLDFAQGLRRRLVEARVTMQLHEAVCFGMGISYGGCKFSVLDGKPVSESSNSESGAWYEAAKLQGMAEKLCKYYRESGGVILVSNSISSELPPERCEQRRMKEFNKAFEDSEVNIYLSNDHVSKINPTSP